MAPISLSENLDNYYFPYFECELSHSSIPESLWPLEVVENRQLQSSRLDSFAIFQKLSVFFVSQNKKERGEKKKLTAPGIPRRSPIQVLTRPDPA